MKIGFNALPVPADQLAEAARAAEAAGFESVWTADHLVFAGSTESKYPYSADGASPVGPATPFPDPLATLAYVAGVTTSLKLGTAVYILPLRSPIVTAKLAATVDALSGGRLLFGVGMGWMAEEFEIAGEEFGNRIERAEEYIEVMKSLWGDGPGVRGKHYDVSDAHQSPKPIQKPHPPLVFGGETGAALRRAARLGDGWIGMHQTPESVALAVAKLARFRKDAGAKTGAFEITVLGGSAPEVSAIRALGDAGVDRVIVYPFTRGNRAAVDLQRYGEDVVARVSPRDLPARAKPGSNRELQR